MRGVVRVDELARTRQMEVVEPRQPEAQRRGAQAAPAIARARRRSAARTASYAPTSAVDELGHERAASAPSLTMHQSLTVIARSYARKSVAAKPKSMMPDTRSPTNSTLSQKRSPWIAPRGMPDLGEARQELELGGQQLVLRRRRETDEPRAQPAATTTGRGGW